VIKEQKLGRSKSMRDEKEFEVGETQEAKVQRGYSRLKRAGKQEFHATKILRRL